MWMGSLGWSRKKDTQYCEDAKTMLTRTKIRNLTHAAFYARGLDLYLSDKVKELQMRKESFVDMVDARVEGSGTKEYHVRICT